MDLHDCCRLRLSSSCEGLETNRVGDEHEDRHLLCLLVIDFQEELVAADAAVVLAARAMKADLRS